MYVSKKIFLSIFIFMVFLNGCVIGLPGRDNDLEKELEDQKSKITPSEPYSLELAGMVQGKIRIRWNKPTLNTNGTPLTDLFGFTITKLNDTLNIEETIYIGNVDTYLDANIQINNVYIYKVAAVNSKGYTSKFSSTIQVNYSDSRLKPGKIVGNIYELDEDNDQLPVDLKVTIKIIPKNSEIIPDTVVYPNEIGVDGYFEIPDLLPGEYDLEFYAQGYKTFIISEQFGTKIIVGEDEIKRLSSDIIFDKI